MAVRRELIMITVNMNTILTIFLSSSGLASAIIRLAVHNFDRCVSTKYFKVLSNFLENSIPNDCADE